MSIKDEIKNWELLEGYKNSTHSIFTFCRALQTCDDEDIEINENAVYLIYSSSNKKPTSEDKLIHNFSNQGSRRVRLLEPPPPDIDYSREDIKHWDAVLSNFIPHSKENSINQCKIFKAPELKMKHHIFKTDLLTESKLLNFTHHIVLLECPHLSENQIQGASNDDGFECSKKSHLLRNCATTVGVFSVGDKSLTFPDHCGIPFYKNIYYVMNVHFENLNSYQGKQPLSAGIRFYYTSQKNMEDLSIMKVGVLHHYSSVPKMWIPPRQPSFTLVGHTHPKCFDTMLPLDGVKIIGVNYHSHKLGRHIKIRHFRGDTELPPIVDDPNYDFNNQGFYFLRNEVLFLKGDQLTTECTYDTTGRDNVTYIGSWTYNEMCLVFLIYYPKMPISTCFSTSSSVFDSSLFFEPSNLHKPRLKKIPANWSNRDLSEAKWVMRYSPQVSFLQNKYADIIQIEGLISYPLNYKEYIKPNICSDENDIIPPTI